MGFFRCTGQELPSTERAINSANIVEVDNEKTFRKVDSTPDEKLEFEELQEFIESNEIASKIFALYEAPIQLKEPQKTTAKFPKLTTIQSKALCKQAVEVHMDKRTSFKTPEDIFAQVLKISDKSVPLPEITERFKPKKSMMKLPKSQPNYMKLKRSETHENFKFKSQQKQSVKNIFEKQRVGSSAEK